MEPLTAIYGGSKSAGARSRVNKSLCVCTQWLLSPPTVCCCDFVKYVLCSAVFKYLPSPVHGIFKMYTKERLCIYHPLFICVCVTCFVQLEY